MIFGVLANPAIAVVDVGCVNVVISNLRQNVKPLLQKFRTEAVVRTRVRKVDDKLKWRVTKWFESQDHMVNKKITVGFANSEEKNFD